MRPVIFLDDGGVMNDNKRREAQWQRLVGEFFTPLLGGSPEAWAAANRVVAPRLFDPANWQSMYRAARDVAEFYRRYDLAWLGGMCDLVGVPTPPDPECADLVTRAITYVTQRVRASFPGVIEAIQELGARGFQLHTASGERSIELEGYLHGMGIRDRFGRLYGPDLIGVAKDGPEYYRRVFADASVTPAEALVVDDGHQPARWAMQAGARAVLVSGEGAEAPNGAPAIRGLVELPHLIERLLNEG